MDYRWSAKPLMTWIGTNMSVATSLGANTSCYEAILWDFTKESPL